MRPDGRGADDPYARVQRVQNLLVPRGQRSVGKIAVQKADRCGVVFPERREDVPLCGRRKNDDIRNREADPLKGGASEDNRYHAAPSFRKRGLPSPYPCCMAAFALAPGL